MNPWEDLEQRLTACRPRRPSARLEARLFGPAPGPGRGTAAAGLSAAAACVLLLGVLSQGFGPLSTAALGQDLEVRDWRSPGVFAAGPVNAVHRGQPRPATNTAATAAFASLLLGQTNFLNR